MGHDSEGARPVGERARPHIAWANVCLDPELSDWLLTIIIPMKLHYDYSE